MNNVVFNAEGMGTIGCNVDEEQTAFGRLFLEDGAPVTLRGHWNATGIEASGGGYELSLTPSTKRGPAMRGSVVFVATGEVANVVAWTPKEGNSYGLSIDQPMVRSETTLPF